MDAPKCRLCGRRHSGVAHVWDDAQRPVTSHVTSQPSAPLPAASRPAAKSGAARVAKWKAAHPDEARARHREYMRKRRAKV